MMIFDLNHRETQKSATKLAQGNHVAIHNYTATLETRKASWSLVDG